MKDRRRTWLVVMIAGLLGACAMEESGTAPPPPEQPVAEPAPAPACLGNACDLPGAEPCCGGTFCEDFSVWGGPQCTTACELHEDCASGCCDNGTCMAEEFCGVAGIYPEAFCEVGDVCGFDESSGCVDRREACLAQLSGDDLSYWLQRMDACFETTTCEAFQTCWLAVPWC